MIIKPYSLAALSWNESGNRAVEHTPTLKVSSMSRMRSDNICKVCDKRTLDTHGAYKQVQDMEVLRTHKPSNRQSPCKFSNKAQGGGMKAVKHPRQAPISIWIIDIVPPTQARSTTFLFFFRTARIVTGFASPEPAALSGPFFGGNGGFFTEMEP